MQNYSSRQEKKPIYREDTGLVCASRASLWRKGKRIGNKVILLKNENPIDIDIHTEYDLYMANKAIKYFKKQNPEMIPAKKL